MVVDQSLVCYIIDNNTGAMITFNIEKPEGYSDTYSANFQQQDVRARSSPFQSYINSGPRSISFSVILSLDYRRNLDEQTELVRKMMKPLNRGTNMSIKSPSLHVKIGKALDINAIPQSFSAEWSEGYKEGVFRLCTWSFAFTEVEDASSYNESEGEIESIIPSGLNYIASDMRQGTFYSVGDSITITRDMPVYESANDANNRRPNTETLINPGEYNITNIRGEAMKVATRERGDLGWLVP